MIAELFTDALREIIFRPKGSDGPRAFSVGLRRRLDPFGGGESPRSDSDGRQVRTYRKPSKAVRTQQRANLAKQLGNDHV